MQRIIEDLTGAIASDEPMRGYLDQHSGLRWVEEYPVAVVHEKRRVKEGNACDWMEKEGLFDVTGSTPHLYDDRMIKQLNLHAPSYLKKVSWIALEGSAEKQYRFEEKRPLDYWKKLVDPGNLKAVVEVSTYGTEDICQIETDLRNLMRSSKEVPTLRNLGYAWIVKVSKNKDIEPLIRHYFGENHKVMSRDEDMVHIGWRESLNEINMRYFLCSVS
jgi:hypothetical protein